jgi:uncharacterized protein (TIGR00369 family)
VAAGQLVSALTRAEISGHGADRMSERSDSPARCAYATFVGWSVADVSPDRAALRLACGHETANRNGSLHGGVIASLLDAAATLAASHAPGGGVVPAASTIDLAVHFLDRSTSAEVVATASTVRRGRELVFLDAVLDDGHTRVARAAATVRVSTNATEGRAGPLNPSVLAEGTRLVPRRSGSPFTARLGVLTATLERGHVVLVLPFRPDLANDRGALHQGALAALVDCAGGAATWSIDGFDAAGRAATIGMHLGFAAAPPGDDVVVEANVAWYAEGIFTSAVTLTGRSTGLPVANGSITYRLVRPLS